MPVALEDVEQAYGAGGPPTDDLLAPLVPAELKDATVVSDDVRRIFEEEAAPAPDDDRQRRRFMLGEAFKTSFSPDLDRDAAILKFSSTAGLRSDVVRENFEGLKASYELGQKDIVTWERDHPEMAAAIGKGHPTFGAKVLKEESFVSRLVRGLSAWQSEADHERDILAARQRVLFGIASAEQTAAAKERTETERLVAGEKVQSTPLLPEARVTEAYLDPSASGSTWEKTAAKYRDTVAGQKLSLLWFRRAMGEDSVALQQQIADLELEAVPKSYGESFLESFPVEAAGLAPSIGVSTLGAAAGAGAGYLLGRGKGAAAGMQLGSRIGSGLATFPLEVGGAFQEFSRMKADDGTAIPEGVSRNYAFLYGVASSAIEAMPGAETAILGPFMDAIRLGDKKAFFKAVGNSAEFRKLAADIGSRWLSGAKSETLEEVYQGVAQHVLGWSAKLATAKKLQSFGVEKLVEDSVQTALATFKGTFGLAPLTAGSTVAAQAYGSTRRFEARVDAAEKEIRERASAEGAKKAEQILKFAGDSESVQVAPDMLADIVKNATAQTGDPVTSMHVDPAPVLRFFQENEADPAQEAEKLLGPGGLEKLRDAAATGQKVEVPVADYFAKWAKAPVHGALSGAVTVQSGHLTGAELREQAEAEARAFTKAQEIAAQYEDEKAPVESQAELEWVAAQRRGLEKGGMAKDDIKKSLALVRAFARTRATELGESAEQFFLSNPVTVEFEDDAAPGAPPAGGEGGPVDPDMEALVAGPAAEPSDIEPVEGDTAFDFGANAGDRAGKETEAYDPSYGSRRGVRSTLFQVSPGLGAKLDNDITVTVAERRADLPANPTKTEAARYLTERAKRGTVENVDQGWLVDIRREGLSKTAQLPTDANLIAAVDALPRLIERAVHAEVWDEQKGRRHIKEHDYLYAPMRIGDTLYRVKLTIRHFAKESGGDRKLHKLVAIEIENPASLAEESSPEASPEATSQQRPPGTIKVRQLLAGVKTRDNKDLITEASKGATFYQSDIPPARGPIWHSAAQKAAENAKQAKGDATSWKAVISKTPGVKAEELEVSGFNDWLAEQKGPITREQVAGFFKENTIQIEEKVLGGAGSKPSTHERDQTREELRALGVRATVEESLAAFSYTSDKGVTVTDRSDIISAVNRDSGPGVAKEVSDAMQYFDHLVEEEFSEAHAGSAQYANYSTKEGATPGTYRELLFYAPGSEGFTSSHFGEHGKNLLAHARFSENTLEDGTKVLLVDEVQSDLHQKGREEGYATPDARKAAEARREAAQKRRVEAGSKLSEMMNARFTGTPREIGAEVARTFEKIEEGRGELPDWLLEGEAVGLVAEYQRAHSDRRVAAEDAFKAKGGVPSAPYKESWEPLIVRRLIRWAAEHGYEKIAWTTGETQAERYSLAQRVAYIGYVEEDQALIGENHQGRTIFHEKDIKPEDVPGIIGKEAAAKLFESKAPRARLVSGEEALTVDKVSSPERRATFNIKPDDWVIVSAEGEMLANYPASERADAEEHLKEQNEGYTSHELRGADLKIGGEGMRVAYDKRIPGIVEKLVKKHGGKVQRQRLQGVDTKDRLWLEVKQDGGKYMLVDQETGVAFDDQRFASAVDAMDHLRSVATVEPGTGPNGYILTDNGRQGPEVWTATLPAPYREQVLREGMPLFQGESATPRGRLDISREGTKNVFNIVLTKRADLSTFLHESGHVFLEIMGSVAAQGNTSPRIDEMLKDTLKFLGVDSFDQVQREHHEKFARSFEAYLREGKAPSVGLARAFQKFKLWLQALYKNASSLNVELSDEIRDVFDRLLATDEEIARVKRAAGLKPMFRSHEEMGVTPEQFADYLEEQEEATALGARSAEFRLLKDKLRESEAWWKKEERELRKAADEAFDALPATRALAYIRTGKVPGADARLGPQKLDADLAREVLGADGPKDLTTKEGGVHPDDVAMMFDFPSGKAMLEALAVRPEKGQWTKDRAHELMTERHGDMLEDKQKLAELVARGVHGDYTAKWLEREWKALGKRTGQKAPLAAIKRAAQLIAERRTLAEMKPAAALRAERSAANKAAMAAAKGAYAQAYVYKQQQLLNFHLHRALTEGRDERDSFEKLLGKVTQAPAREKLGLAGPSFVGTVDSITEALGAKETDPAAPEAEGLDEFIDAVGPDLGPAFDVKAIRALLAKPRGWETLTLPEMRNVKDALTQIQHIAKTYVAVTMAEEQVAQNLLAQTIATQAAAYNPKEKLQPPKSASQKPLLYDMRQAWAGMKAANVEPEEIFRALGKAAHDFFFRGYLASRNAEHALSGKVLAFFEKNWDALPEEMRKRRYDVIDSSALPYPADVNRAGATDRQWMWMVALNMGNASNKERLLGGYRWTETQVMDFLNKSMTKEEWQFIQGTWDMLDQELFPEISRAYELANGLPPPKIKATSVVTPHGTFRGGYFPAKYDPVASRPGAAQGEEGIRLSANSARASVSRSFTKERAKNFSDVINLDWGSVPGHVAQTIHYVTHDRFVRDAQRMLGRADVKDTIQRRLGLPYEAQVDSWLKAVAGTRDEGTPQLEGLTKAMGAFRSRFAMATLGGSLRVMLGDLGNYAMAIALGDVKISRLAPAIVTLPFNFAERRAQVLALSKEMNLRSESYASKLRKEIADVGVSGNKALLDPLREMMFEGFKWTDILTSTPIWEARYTQELKAGKSQAEAVQIADDMIRASYPASMTAEQSALLRDKKSIGTLLAFFGYFAKMGNRVFVGLPRQARLEMMQRQEDGKPLAVVLPYTKLAGRMLAVFTVLGPLNALLSGQGPGDDEDEGEWLMRKTLSAPASMLPGIGGMLEPLAGMAAAATFGNKYKYKPITSRAAPVLTGAESMAKALYKAMTSEGDKGEEMFWALIEFAALAAKLPVNQPKRTGGYIKDVLEDEAEVGPWETPKGLVMGSPKKR